MLNTFRVLNKISTKQAEAKQTEAKAQRAASARAAYQRKKQAKLRARKSRRSKGAKPTARTIKSEGIEVARGLTKGPQRGLRSFKEWCQKLSAHFSIPEALYIIRRNHSARQAAREQTRVYAGQGGTVTLPIVGASSLTLFFSPAAKLAESNGITGPQTKPHKWPAQRPQDVKEGLWASREAANKKRPKSQRQTVASFNAGGGADLTEYFPNPEGEREVLAGGVQFQASSVTTAMADCQELAASRRPPRTKLKDGTDYAVAVSIDTFPFMSYRVMGLVPAGTFALFAKHNGEEKHLGMNWKTGQGIAPQLRAAKTVDEVPNWVKANLGKKLRALIETETGEAFDLGEHTVSVAGNPSPLPGEYTGRESRTTPTGQHWAVCDGQGLEGIPASVNIFGYEDEETEDEQDAGEQDGLEVVSLEELPEGTI